MEDDSVRLLLFAFLGFGALRSTKQNNQSLTRSPHPHCCRLGTTGFLTALQVRTWGQPEHNPAVGRSRHVPTQRYMLACRVNVAEQTLCLAI